MENMEMNDLSQKIDENKRDRTKRFLFYKEDVFPVPF